ncbi:MAG TPA: hypothetical protein VM899_00585, partial [Rubellimicrobium sp.]|nr:hypothetical protein [Rubellimicrobium sp.]
MARVTRPRREAEQLAAEVFAQRHARVEGAVVDPLAGDVQAGQLVVRLPREPFDQRLGHGENFDAGDVREHRGAVEHGRVGHPPAGLGRGLEKRDVEREGRAQNLAQGVEAGRPGANDADARRHGRLP